MQSMKMMKYPFVIPVYAVASAVLLAMGLFLSSCEKDATLFQGDARIEVSADTVFFDTLFTAVGSATQYIKIYNRESAPVQVNLLQTKQLSQFRFNVDGEEGLDGGPYEIGANDSIYVFIEVTIQPDAPLSVSPFFVEDQLVISQGSQKLEVQLIAYGQNANYIPSINGKGGISVLSCNLGTVSWTDEKPYVIYGVLVIDSCTLVLPEACKVYVHGGIVVNDAQAYNDGQIIVLRHGSIRADGSPERKVEITGDRPETEFQYLAGQWGGIRFVNGSRNNEFKDVIVRNAIVGFIADSASVVNLEAVEISHCAAFGIYARHAETSGSNLLIHNTGSHAIAIAYGGRHRYDFCTLSTTENQDESLTLSNYYCTDPLCQGALYINDLDFTITNSIITGASSDEIALLPSDSGDLGTRFKYAFSNCVVRVKDLLKPKSFPAFMDECKSCILQESSSRMFEDEDKYNFRPDSAAVFLDKGIPVAGITRDLEGKSRNTATPDPGCFEK